MERAYEETAPEILSIYPPPCVNDEDPDCNCVQVHSDWIAGKFVSSRDMTAILNSRLFVDVQLPSLHDAGY